MALGLDRKTGIGAWGWLAGPGGGHGAKGASGMGGVEVPGSLAALRMTAKATTAKANNGKDKRKAKCRDLSTARGTVRLSRASVEMTFLCVECSSLLLAVRYSLFPIPYSLFLIPDP
jgi:hypothetical protein